jgi:drug/metabolite transporter (DMT)-like permease
MRLRISWPEFLVLFAALIWGFAFYFQKTAMQDVGPFAFTGFRTAIASICLLPFALREHASSKTSFGSTIPAVFMGAVAFLLGGVLQQQGLITASVTNTSFITALYVVMTPFLFWLLRHERPSFVTWISIALAFLGIWALGGGGISSLSTGDFWVLSSVVFWSLFMVATSIGAKAGRPAGYTCVAFALVALVAIPMAVLFERVDGVALTAALPELLFVGIFSSALTFALLAMALRHIPGHRASVLLATETLFAAVAGYALLGEKLGWINWLGAALLFCAVLFNQLAPSRN